MVASSERASRRVRGARRGVREGAAVSLDEEEDGDVRDGGDGHRSQFVADRLRRPRIVSFVERAYRRGAFR